MMVKRLTVLLLCVPFASPSWAGDSASMTLTLESPQPSGYGCNRWTPFWVELRGSVDFKDGSQYDCDGFELWLKYDPNQVAFDLENDGITNDYSYSKNCPGSQATVFESLGWTPDFTGITKVSIDAHRFLRIGVTFDTDGAPAHRSLDTPVTNGVFIKLRLHTLDWSGSPTALSIWSEAQNSQCYSYFVKHPPTSNDRPAAIQISNPGVAYNFANTNLPLFVRGNANGSSPPAPPADPKAAVTLEDGMRVLKYVFVDPALNPIGCMEAADANDDNRINLLDAVYIFQWYWNMAADFPPPLDQVGIDNDGDGIGCATSQL